MSEGTPNVGSLLTVLQSMEELDIATPRRPKFTARRPNVDRKTVWLAVYNSAASPDIVEARRMAEIIYYYGSCSDVLGRCPQCCSPEYRGKYSQVLHPDCRYMVHRRADGSLAVGAGCSACTFHLHPEVRQACCEILQRRFDNWVRGQQAR